MCYESRNLSKGHLICQRNNSNRNSFRILQESTKEKQKETHFWFIGITAVHVYVKYYWKKTENQDNTVLIKCCTFIMSYCCQPDITSYILNKYCKISWKTKNVLGVLSWTYHSIARSIQIKSKNQDHRLPRHKRLYVLVFQCRVPELSQFR